MFERFTDGARHAIVVARDEAHRLGQPEIGTGTMLLGILHETDGAGGEALAAHDLTIEAAERVITAGGAAGRGLIALDTDEPDPLTQHAKRLLELALQEALALGHNDIGTGHLVLALARQPGTTAARVLDDAVVDRKALRTTVLELLARPTPRVQVARPVRSVGSLQLSPETQELLAWSARKALRFGVNYASKGSLPMRLLGTAGNAALGMDGSGGAANARPPSDRGPVQHGPADATSARGGSALAPATCSFCGTPSPACGALFSGTTGALICERCVGGVPTDTPGELPPG